MEAILAALPPDPAVGVVILDACRDNPLARTLAASLPKSRSSAVGTGLAVVQANEQASTSGGLLIAYATDPGSVAYDGNNANSPYTTALAKHLAAPGVEIQSALTRVRAEVADTTKGAQRPWHNASLAREVFIGRTPTVANSTPIQMPTPAATTDGDGSQINWTVEQAVWEEASKRNTIAHYEFYISQYPQGRFVNLALLNIKQLKESGQNQDNIPGTPAGAGETKIATAVPTADNATRSEGSSTNQDSIPSTPLEAGEIEIAAAVPADQNTTKSEVSGSAPGTPQTEAQLNWDKEDRIDLQLRLRALGLYADDVDGALGARSRAAIAAWQRQRGIVETTYLSAEQHMLLVVQSDPFIAKVRAEYEAMQAAKFQQQTVEKAKPKTASGEHKEAAGRQPGRSDRDGEAEEKPDLLRHSQPKPCQLCFSRYRDQEAAAGGQQLDKQAEGHHDDREALHEIRYHQPELRTLLIKATGLGAIVADGLPSVHPLSGKEGQ